MHCVYRHIDKNGRLLYVGCSMRPVDRQLLHRQTSRWFKDIVRVEIEQVGTKLQALAREARAIIEEKPLYNIRRNPRARTVRDMKYLRYLEKCRDRNEIIYALRDKGVSMGDIGKRHRMSRQRVYQILAKRPKKRNGS